MVISSTVKRLICSALNINATCEDTKCTVDTKANPKTFSCEGS